MPEEIIHLFIGLRRGEVDDIRSGVGCLCPICPGGGTDVDASRLRLKGAERIGAEGVTRGCVDACARAPADRPELAPPALTSYPIRLAEGPEERGIPVDLNWIVFPHVPGQEGQEARRGRSHPCGRQT